MNEWIDALDKLLDAGERAVLLTVAGVRGSAPREPGARMLVTSRETIGTIGGGQLEYQCTKAACRLLAEGVRPQPALRRFVLGANCGQCCGGVADVLFELVECRRDDWFDAVRAARDERRDTMLITAVGDPSTKWLVDAQGVESFGAAAPLPATVLATARAGLVPGCAAGREDGFLLTPLTRSAFHVAVFGAGHVGTALVDVLSRIDCEVRWIDSRRNAFPTTLPDNVQAVETAAPADEVAAMPPGAHYVIMTHSHPLDLEICDRALRRDDAAYCGLIGSVSKRRRFERRLAKLGLSEAELERLVCPIRIAGIDDKRPASIAIAVAAELLQARDARSGVAPAPRPLPAGVR